MLECIRQVDSQGLILGLIAQSGNPGVDPGKDGLVGPCFQYLKITNFRLMPVVSNTSRL